MYKKLKPELEEVVSNLKFGDGIVIEHPSNFYADRTIGYVKKMDASKITLTKTRLSKIFLESFFNHFLGMEIRHYEDFEDVRVVDPMKKE